MMMMNSDLPRNKERSVADIAAGNPRTCTGAGDNALRLPSHSRALSSVRHQHRPNNVRESPTARSLHAACESKGIICCGARPTHLRLPRSRVTSVASPPHRGARDAAARTQSFLPPRPPRQPSSPGWCGALGAGRVSSRGPPSARLRLSSLRLRAPPLHKMLERRRRIGEGGGGGGGVGGGAPRWMMRRMLKDGDL